MGEVTEAERNFREQIENLQERLQQHQEIEEAGTDCCPKPLEVSAAPDEKIRFTPPATVQGLQFEGISEESLKTGFVRVATFGAKGYQTHLLPGEIRISRELLTQFERELKKILDEVWDVYEEKGLVYDQSTPVWHHFAFGLVSFATEVYLKATRFVSLLQGGEATSLEENDDTLRDVLVYSWYSWAYARLLARTEE